MSHYEKGKAPVEWVSTVEEHYHQIFILAEKYYIKTLQAMEIVLLKALCEEDFGHEL